MKEVIFYKQINKLRQFNSFNITEFCQEIGVNKTTYWKWVNYGQLPKSTTLLNIINRFPTTFEWLMFGSDHNKETK